MFNELAKEGIKSAIVFWPDYLLNLKSSFGTDEYQNKINKIKKVSLLLIDDIGAETTTSWSRDEVLCPIIQYRMQEKLPTFFTSNLDLNLLEQHLATSKNGIEEVKAKRIIERIKQLTEEQDLITKNYRK
jgi:primosomal protein DnaI